MPPDGTLFDRSEFHYDKQTDTSRCPANQTLVRKQLSRKDRAVYYATQPEVCGACALKARCTNGRQRLVSRHLHEDAFRACSKEQRRKWCGYGGRR
jgi:hypothetical protein